MVNSLGKGLSVIIRCELIPQGNWMSFATWYSIAQNLPDASIQVYTHNLLDKGILVFDWPARLGVAQHRYSTTGKPQEWHMVNIAKAAFLRKVDKPLLVIDYRAELVRPPDLTTFGERIVRSKNNLVWYFGKEGTEGEVIDDLCIEASDERVGTFVSIAEGCGKFVADDWIHSNDGPFPAADRFAADSMSANEVQVLKLWKHLSSLFSPSGGA